MMNPWIWLGVTIALIVIAFAVAYRYAPKGARTKLTQLLTIIAGAVAAGIGALAGIDWSQFEAIGPVMVAVIPVVLGYINNKLRDITDSKPTNLFFKKE